MLNHRETGSGRPLVLLHAFPLNSRMWEDVLEPLGGYRLITVDLPGFGGSPLDPAAPDLEASAQAVLQVLDSLGLERTVLCGSSMGGYVAMRLLAAAPERIEALILADTKASADPPAGAANRERIAAAVEGGDEGVLFRDVLPTLLAPDAPDAVRDRVAALISAAPAPAVAWAQRAMAARPDSFAVLRAVSAPALVVRGAQDGLSGAADAEAMLEALPGARSVTIEGAGHLPPMECPDEFAAAVRAFLG